MPPVLPLVARQATPVRPLRVRPRRPPQRAPMVNRARRAAGAGEARGDTLFLSRFDGGTAYLILARLGADGTISGEQYTGGGSHDSFRGRRDPSATLDRSVAQTVLVRANVIQQIQPQTQTLCCKC